MASIFFSAKADGDLLFKSKPTNADLKNSLIDADGLNEEIKINRLRFFLKHGIDPKRVVNCAGVHGTRIHTVTKNDLGSGALDPDTRIKDTDGLITDILNSYLMVTGADCFPVLFSANDESNSGIPRYTTVIGVAHAGWRGIIGADTRRSKADSRGSQNGIVPKMIEAFKERFSVEPNDIRAWIGPGIRACHFEVQNDVAPLFSDEFPTFIENREGQTFINLPEIIKDQLAKKGILSRNINEHPDCTFCNATDWYSWRRDKPRCIQANSFLIVKK